MEVKPGKETSEFKLTAVTNVVNAFLALFVAYGILTQEESALWGSLLLTAVVLILPIASALMTKAYTNGRNAIKLEAMQPGAAQANPKAAE